jgi:hypothetical protein
MKIKTLVISLLLLAFTLTACSAPTPTTAADQNAPQQPGQNGGPAGGGPQNTLESRLAMGTLKLEGTSQAVTADQAKQLLPLWQQVKTLETNTTNSQADMQAVYQNIEKAMTADQIKAIQDMNPTQSDIQDLIKSLGITPPAGGAGRPNGGTSFPTMSPDQRATRQAERTLTPGNGGGFGGGRGGFGFNRIFVDPLIQVLQKRAGA